MARRKPTFIPEPRIWSEHQVACRLGISQGTFRLRLPKLTEKGFPQPDDLLDGWDAAAIEYWLDRRSGLDTGTGFQREYWLGLLDKGSSERAERSRRRGRRSSKIAGSD